MRVLLFDGTRLNVLIFRLLGFVIGFIVVFVVIRCWLNLLRYLYCLLLFVELGVVLRDLFAICVLDSLIWLVFNYLG